MTHSGLPAGDNSGHDSYPDLPLIEPQIEFDEQGASDTNFE